MDKNDKNETIKMLEEKTHKTITWYSECPLYVNSLTKQAYQDVLFYQSGIEFGVYCPSFSESFESLEILYTDTVLKTDADSFLENKIPKVKRANPLKTIGKKTLLSLELDNNKGFRFIDIKTSEFKQLLSIAQAKQKYSRQVNS